ncbi:hypothetical protein pipiens_002648 [Culex pipiens pipiens]|uniref:peptidyl-tRNA hydrolase n=1 Tax=Culex pipiens pipiens TaxID=38569 RepID=A0ABD1DBB9_CULPP
MGSSRRHHQPSIGSVEKQAILVEPVQYHPGPIGKYQNLLPNGGSGCNWVTNLVQDFKSRSADSLHRPPNSGPNLDAALWQEFGDFEAAFGKLQANKLASGRVASRMICSAARLPRKTESGGINKVNFSVTVAVAPKIPCMHKLDEKSRKKPPLNNPLIVVPSGNWRKTYVYVIHPKDCYLKTRLGDQKVEHLTSVQTVTDTYFAANYHKMSAATKLVQYVVVNGEIAKSWPKGAVIAQCCHAVAAVSHLYAADPDTVEYFKDLDNMHKVVLEAPDVGKLTGLGEALEKDGIKHKVWIEQPENVPTCIALKPYKKEEVHKYVKKFKLLS